MARGKFKNAGIQAIYNRWIDTMVNQLTNEGHKIINEAYETSNDGDRDYDDREYNAPHWKNISGTLMESYGSAVYVNGRLRTDSMRYVGSFSMGDSNSTDYIAEYLTAFHPSPKNIITLVCVNAAPYAEDLEQGRTIKERKYIVISQMADEMEAVNKRIVIPNKYRQGIIKIGDI